jgi:hypothetical protein
MLYDTRLLFPPIFRNMVGRSWTPLLQCCAAIPSGREFILNRCALKRVSSACHAPAFACVFAKFYRGNHHYSLDCQIQRRDQRCVPISATARSKLRPLRIKTGQHPTKAAYSYLTTALAEYLQLVHSKICLSCRGRSSSIPASHILAPQFWHGGRNNNSNS